MYTSLAKRQRASTLNHNLLVFLAAVLFTLYLAEMAGVAGAVYILYLVEDTGMIMVMMQSATVAQMSFSTQDAKRCLGLVQFGNSMGAITVGMAAGPLSKALGAENLLLVQCLVLGLSLLPNLVIDVRYMGGGGKKKSKGKGKKGQAQDEGPWWMNGLVLSMAFWTFAIIYCKTISEYQFNIFAGEMVRRSRPPLPAAFLAVPASVVDMSAPDRVPAAYVPACIIGFLLCLRWDSPPHLLTC